MNHSTMLILPYSKAWFTPGAKNFVRRVFFCIFMISVERQKISAFNNKFPVYIKETKTKKILGVPGVPKFFVIRKQGVRVVTQIQ